MASIDRLAIQGPTLAAWIQSVAFGGRYCDGLIFGNLQTEVVTQAHDHDDAVTSALTSCQITGTLACVSTQSFYNAAGSIDGDRLAQLLAAANQHQQQLLGWFVYRPECTAQLLPSLREVAVTRALHQWWPTQQSTSSSWQGAARPLLFALLSSSVDHNNATHCLKHRLFQYNTTTTNSSSSSQQPSLLQPLRLHVDNLGASNPSSSSSGSHGPAGSTHNSHGAQPGSTAPGGTLYSGSSRSLLTEALAVVQLQPEVQQQLAAAVAAAQQQAAVLGSVHSALLQQLSELTDQAAAEGAELSALRQENEELLQQVRQRQQAALQ